MRVLIVTAGSWGDVAPYTGLGVRLREAGHDVTVATHAVFEDAVAVHGLGFRGLPVDPRAELASAQGALMSRSANGAAAVARMARMARGFLPQLTAGVTEAVRAGADVMLSATLTDPLCTTLTEATGVPSLGVYLQPVTPTAHFPPVVSGSRSLGRHGNRLAAKGLLTATDGTFRPAVATLRRELGLPRRRRASPTATLRARPVLHGYSPHVVPRPPDWPDRHRVCGYWWPAVPPDWRPEQRLVDFLAAGPPPVFVGFGSMVTGEAGRLSALVTAALRRAGVRGVVQAGWSGLTAADGDDVLPVADVPHAWLFPRTAAVVHHAGGGTSAAGLRAGVPAVPVPVLLDQRFWAVRLAALGAATAPLPYRRLTVDRLASAIRAATTDPARRDRARRLASRLADEDGCTPVLAALDRLA
jgi:UDP:flavonoid glycosyltransferase YjiC (YdhE family)